jgi:hypothetical protein
MYTSVVALLCVVVFGYVGILAAVLSEGRGGGWWWFAELPLPLPPYSRYPGMDSDDSDSTRVSFLNTWKWVYALTTAGKCFNPFDFYHI